VTTKARNFRLRSTVIFAAASLFAGSVWGVRSDVANAGTLWPASSQRLESVARVGSEATEAAGSRLIVVRVGTHKGFTRLVFDWQSPIPYSVAEAGNKVTVVFDRKARIDLERLRTSLSGGLANPQVREVGGRLEFTIEKPPGVNVHHFLVGAKVVLDFGAALPARKTAKTPPPAQTAEAPGPTSAESKVETSPSAPSVGPVVEAKQPASAKAGKVAASKSGSAKKSADVPQPAVAALTFEFPNLTGAAVFRRDPYIWIVFDRRITLSVDALRKAASGVVEAMEQLPVGTGTAIRLLPKPGVNPQAERKENTWTVRLRTWPIAPQIPISLQVRVDGANGAELTLPVSELGQVLHLPDPGVGDMLLVATLRGSGHGIPDHRRYPQFELLASAQGVAVKPLDDELELQDAGAGGIAMTRPNGLHLSAVTQEGAVSGVLTGPRVFDFASWGKGPAGNFSNALRSAIRATTEVPKDRRDEARLDLARLYFAHGMAPEAIGVLRTMEYANSPLAGQPEFHALKGASLVYMGRNTEARKELLDTRLDRYQEIALWRASMYFGAREIDKAAALFRAGDAVLLGYPEPYKTKFALQWIEAGIQTLDVANASRWVKRLDKDASHLTRQDLARLRYNQGLLARQGRDLDRAVKYWTDVKATGDIWNSARAEFALVELGLQQETITRDEAIERLERLSYQWRGDELELAVVNTLGRLYLAKGDYRQALSRMRTAVTYFPDKRESKATANMMAGTFKSLYLEGKADTLSPLKALALFDDFRELTPPGPEGDVMIQKLVDRLIGADLLDHAAGLLSHQVQFRLKGHKKAESGAKLALIHLLDRNPDAALLALRASFQPNLPLRIEDDRRRIRAKAKLDLGQSEEAIALLAGDVSMEADLLRLDRYWNTKNYAEAAKVLQRLAGEPAVEGAYGPQQVQYILNWAVALRLKRDEAGLKVLRDLYGAGMAMSPLAETFAFIVQSSEGSREDIEAISRRLNESDGFDAFLRNYRERLMPPTTAVSTEKTIQGEDASNGEGDRRPGADIPAPPPLPRR